ncbi:MAG: terpene cyclase/mutase family protein [Thermoguttaceae bacterium]|nr:terpene cyclase/mutase family protein [Thermoguttaceae bacterium]MDW8078162.1 terpene cyclase/mutase family protein [Thermoguttaceae bacterium]
MVSPRDSGENKLAGNVGSPPGEGLARAGGTLGGSSSSVNFWLDGGVLACTCPGCGGPMAIRLWLRLADCFRCLTSVELTEEQVLEAERVLAQSRQSRPRPVPPPVVPPPPSNAAPAQEAKTSYRPSGSFHHQPRPWRIFGHYPSWLISAIFHGLLLLIFGLMSAPGTRPLGITITTTMSPEDEVGEELIWEEDPLIAMELPQVEPAAAEIGAEETLAGTLEVPIPPATLPPATSPVGAGPATEVPEVLPPAMQPGGMLSGRDPTFRRTLAIQRGGSDETEAAVARGLAWLARHQNANGSWSLDRFHLAPKATANAEDGLGSVYSDTAGTALALLPFLGAGQTHEKGEYREVVKAGLRWLIYTQKPDGDLRGPGSGRMYAHGMAAIVLCEAFAMTGDPDLRGPAQRAVDFIVRAQHPEGGWRYDPGQAGDNSVVGWQLMALQSARMHYLLHVPEDTLHLASRFLDSTQADYAGATYGYMPGFQASPAMTAEALLGRLYLGWPPNDRRVRAGVQWLLSEHLPSINAPNFYYWYYGTQVMHHVGGNAFRKWNYVMKPILLELQEKTGRNAGSWPPVGTWAQMGGRIFTTSLAICILEVYYRHMPLNRSEAIEIGQLLQKNGAGTAQPSPPQSEGR